MVPGRRKRLHLCLCHARRAVAWIIGWDLILEYAIGSSGRGRRLVELLRSRSCRHVFGRSIDPRLLSAALGLRLSRRAISASRRSRWPTARLVQAWFNLPGVAITAAVTVILVIGIRESAGFNAAMVLLNIGVILTIVGVGAAYVDPRQLAPVPARGARAGRGVAEGAGRIFFAYIGFDSISTHAEEARNPQRDLAIGILGALIVCTVLYVAVAAVLTGMMPYHRDRRQRPARPALHRRAG